MASIRHHRRLSRSHSHGWHSLLAMVAANEISLEEEESDRLLMKKSLKRGPYVQKENTGWKCPFFWGEGIIYKHLKVINF
jgi:hypothetical protein